MGLDDAVDTVGDSGLSAYRRRTAGVVLQPGTRIVDDILRNHQHRVYALAGQRRIHRGIDRRTESQIFRTSQLRQYHPCIVDHSHRSGRRVDIAHDQRRHGHQQKHQQRHQQRGDDKTFLFDALHVFALYHYSYF